MIRTASNLLVLLFIVVFFSSYVLPAEFVSNNLFFSLNNALNGRFYTAFLALFMHGSYFHLATNSLFLFFFGNELEKKIGWKKFLSLFFIVGVSAFILSSPSYDYNQLLVGASASIFGVMSALALVNPFIIKKVKRVKFIFGNYDSEELESLSSVDQETSIDSYSFIINISIFVLIQVTFISLYRNVVIDSAVSDLGHVFGFIEGIFFGILWSDYWKNFFKKNITTILLTALGILFVSYTLFLAYSVVTDQGSFFGSNQEKCLDYCVATGYTNGLLDAGVCECVHDTGLYERIS